MSGNESPGGGDDSLSLSSSSTSKSLTSISRDTSSIHHLDPKYKNYVNAVDKALKSFEYSSEWHDLISALSKLNKVITTWSGKYGGDLPRLHLVTKRLSQCLHPNLPGGVHLKTLETYELIFKSIPPDRTNNVIGSDLFPFASGLFPLWTYASEQSRPTLLRIYETYLLPQIKYPALEGFLISILSGLSEDDNTAATPSPTVVTVDPLSTIGRVNNLLGNITLNVGAQNFNKVLWQVLKSNSKIRLAGINYVIRRSAITDDEALAIDTLVCCLITSDATNESVLIQRATLDLVLNHFRLASLDDSKKTKLIKASLQTLLRRDMSLNRRLFSWLLGNEAEYFDNHCKPSLVVSCTEMLKDNRLSSSEIVRILITLLDKSEISILDEILLHIVIYFKRINSKQCANLFFTNLKPEYVFDQVVATIKEDVTYCNLLEYLIELDLSCFEYEKLLPNVFKTLVQIANSNNIVLLEPVLQLIVKKIELDPDVFESFVQFYLTFVNWGSSFSSDEFSQFVKPKMMDCFWTDFKLCRENGDIFEKCSSTKSEHAKYENLSVVNKLFEELLDPRILKEIPSLSDWIKALIVIGCHGDVETISLLVKVLKLLEKSLSYEVVEETYLIELATRFLWVQSQYETLSELICLNKVKTEKILLSFLKDYESFGKLIDFLDFVGDFGDIKLLVYKLVENLDCSPEQYSVEFLEMREQAEEFCSKMLRENDLRFVDVFVSNLLVDYESVGEHLSKARRENNNPDVVGPVADCLDSQVDVDRISIEVESVSDLTSECSYKSTEEPEPEPLKANSTPDLTNLNLSMQQQRKLSHKRTLSRSMGDLTQIITDANLPEIVVQDGEKNGDGDDEPDFLEKEPEPTTSTCDDVAAGVVMFSTPKITETSEIRGRIISSSSKGFSKRLNHPHLKVPKSLSEDVQNRILYVLNKLEKFLLLKPDLFLAYLKSCNTNQSPRINFRDDCVYLELLIGKLLEFMCVVIPNDSTFSKSLRMGNLHIQFKARHLLKLLMDRLIDSERLEIASSGNSNILTDPPSTDPSSNSHSAGAVSRRQHFSKLKRKSSTNASGCHFVADLLTRIKVQKTLLFVLRSTTISLKQEDESWSNMGGEDSGADISVELIRVNYEQKYLALFQGLLLSLSRTVISLEHLINSINHHYHTSTSKSSLHRNHPSHKYLSYLPLANQPLFHEILLTALELRDGSTNNSHFNWMDLNLQILPYIINSGCTLTALTMAQICKNLQDTPRTNEAYVLRSLDYMIAITGAVLFRQCERSSKNEEMNQPHNSSSIYGIITSFLPGGSSTPKTEFVDEIDSQSKDILGKLDILLKTALAVKSPTTCNKLRNLLNPICNSYLEHVLVSLSTLEPSSKLVELCREIETIRVEKLTIITTRNLNKNLLLLYRDYMRYVVEIDFGSQLLNALVKECLTKGTGLVTVCEIVNDLYTKFKPDSWSKQELKEVQENLFKIFDKLVAEVCNQNSYLLLDSNSFESNSSLGGQMSFLGTQGSQTKSYNFKKLTTQESMEDILVSMCTHLPNLCDLLWTDDKDRDKVMPLLTHLLGNLIGLLKLRHTSTPSYVSILKLLKNISYYSYFRKAWKKEIFEILLLEPTFFQMIKPHYYYKPYGSEDGDEKMLENTSIVQIWKVIMDNLFTQDKSSFSELLTRVSVPQTSGLNIFTSRDSEFEGRALLLKRLAFVIWSSEQDQFSKYMSNIQERLAEALKTPNSPQIVPVVLKSVFLCFRVLTLKFSNLSALWPIIIHEIVQVLLQLEKQLLNGTKFDQDHLACALEVLKLIELLANLPPETLPLFQMYRWAFIPSSLISKEENDLENNNNGFVPFLLRLSVLVEDPFSSSLPSFNNVSEFGKQKHVNPSKMRTLISLHEVYEFLCGNCDNITVEELCQELDLDFIEC